MKLSSLLDPDFIIAGKETGSKEEAINAILERFKDNYKFNIGIDYISSSIKERELLGGTTFPSGIAIPHARLDNFDDTLIGVLIPKTPVPDGNVGLSMVVLILTSKTVSNVYLNTLAALVKLSRDKEKFSYLTGAADSNDFIQRVDTLNIKVKEEVTVESIMSEDVVSISPGATIKELADSFYKNSIGYLPVIDSEGNFIGEINLMRLVQEGVPDYATQLGRLNFLKSFEPLERLFRKEDEITVSDIMTKPSVVFSRDTSIVEAALEFVNTKRRHIPVVENGKVIGILALIDILNRILRS